MERKPNKLRAKLASGRCVCGTAVFSWSPYVVDVAGLAGLDSLRIDTDTLGAATRRLNIWFAPP